VTFDPAIERPARQMLAHAIGHELPDLAALVQAEGEERFTAVTELCVFVCGYIAIEVNGMRWPGEVLLRKIARLAAQSVMLLDVSEDEIFTLLSRVALGDEELGDVFSVEGIGAVPLCAAASLLLTFCPAGLEWPGYLDQIEDAAQAAAQARPEILPALMLTARKQAPRGQP
jgi:hypothetical protein